MDADFADNIWNDNGETDTRLNRAMAIKACLESLRVDARDFALQDLERFIELASLAAEETVASLAANNGVGTLRYAKPAGAC